MQTEAGTDIEIQGLYGGRWEMVTTAEDEDEAQGLLGDYRRNEPRVAFRRVVVRTQAVVAYDDDAERDAYSNSKCEGCGRALRAIAGTPELECPACDG